MDEYEVIGVNFFEFPEVINDKKTYLLSSPLKNDRNISQIIKNFN